MTPFMVAVGDLPRTDVERRVDGMYERRFSNARVPRQQRHAAFEQFADRFNTDTFRGRNLQHAVSGTFVYGAEFRHGGRILQVGFRKCDRYGHLVGLAGHQEAVYELRGRFRGPQCRQQQCLVDVCGDDMGLLRKVRSPTDHIVAAGTDVADDVVTPVVGLASDLVAHHHRVGRPDAFQTQAPADAAADGLPVVQHLVPTPCGAYHHACEPFSHRLFFVLLPCLLRHLFADPFQERENTLGEAHDGFVTF